MKKLLVLLLLVACGDSTLNVSEGETNMVYGIDTELGVGLRNPEKGPDGWQQSGTMTTGNSQKSVSMQANFPESGYYTVQFAVVPPLGVAGGLNSFEATAIIDWRVEGSSVRRKVSVGNGVSISAPAQGVGVTVNDNTVTATAGNDYTVQIQVARGSRPNPGYPVTFIDNFLQALGPGASFVYDVPLNAGVSSVQIAAGPTTLLVPGVQGVVVEVKNSIGTLLKLYDLATYPDFVPLPPSAATVTVTNLLAAGTYGIQATWGIDG